MTLLLSRAKRLQMPVLSGRDCLEAIVGQPGRGSSPMYWSVGDLGSLGLTFEVLPYLEGISGWPVSVFGAKW